MVIERKEFENNSLHHFPPLNNAFLTQHIKQKSLFLTADPSCDEIIQTKILWGHFLNSEIQLISPAHQNSARNPPYLRKQASIASYQKPTDFTPFWEKKNYILGTVWVDKERTTQRYAANQSGLSVGVRHSSNAQSGAWFWSRAANGKAFMVMSHEEEKAEYQNRISVNKDGIWSSS